MSEEKLNFIRENLDRGDLKQIHARLKGIKYETVRAIINGTFYGKYGDEVVKEALNYIALKLKKAEQERQQLKEFSRRIRGKT